MRVRVRESARVRVRESVRVRVRVRTTRHGTGRNGPARHDTAQQNTSTSTKNTLPSRTHTPSEQTKKITHHKNTHFQPSPVRAHLLVVVFGMFGTFTMRLVILCSHVLHLLVVYLPSVCEHGLTL